MSDKKFEMTLLFDFFGDLLTDKQRDYFDLYYNDDLSLSEIAEENGISRQGVRDIIVRAENTLREFEEKTGVVERFSQVNALVASLEGDVDRLMACSDDENVRKITDEMRSKLQNLKG